MQLLASSSSSRTNHHHDGPITELRRPRRRMTLWVQSSSSSVSVSSSSSSSSSSTLRTQRVITVPSPPCRFLWSLVAAITIVVVISIPSAANAFIVGAAHSQTSTATATATATASGTSTTTNLFLSHDFTRSSSSSSSASTGSSSPSSSMITQAGFRPKTERMGLRKRLRSVLENARRRGGFSSSSTSTTSLQMSKNTTHNDASLIVAEAASIGGLYDAVDFVLVKTGTNGTGTTGTATTSTSSATAGSSLKPLINGAASTTTTTTTSTPPPPDRNGTPEVVVLTAKVNGSSSSTDKNGSSSKSSASTTTSASNQVQVDAILNSGKVAPLPFRLPKLTREQKMKLVAGERIQEQSKMGRDGSGYVVLDVKAPDYVVWECLLDFEKYPEYIGTVRSMQMFTNTHLKQSYIAEKPVLPGTGRETRHYGTASITRASFVLSKFLLKIAAIHKYRPHPAGHYMEFTLDKACRNVVLKDAKGIWYTECNPDGRTGYTRIWLLCELSVSRVLPTFIVDYAAKRAMPRASNWIQPVVERVKKEFHIVD